MRAALSLLLAALALPVQAASAYDNPRFGYSVSIPGGFGPAREADNGDGVTVRAAAGNARLLVYGFNLLEGTFADQVATGMADDAAEGWRITYRTVKARAASWSGTRGGRILYVRAIPLCDDAVGTFRLEYDASAKGRFDPIITGLVRSFSALPCS